MNKDKLMFFFINHHGKLIGALIGFFIGILLITLGFFKTIVLLICSVIGYYIGKKVDNIEDVAEFIERILNIQGKK
mgnify:CR=1 FL=1